MTKIISARIKFLPPEAGGRLEPARDGVTPQLKLGEIFTSTVIRSRAGTTVFDPGATYDVDLEIKFWDQYGSLFDPEAPAEFYEGSRLIAVGEFRSSDPERGTSTDTDE